MGAVTFDRVSFAYHPGRRVLQQVSFTARPGELVALVGPSGAGKSTLATLIARFYDPTEGSVLLDGVDLRELTLAGLRDRIGLVFQDRRGKQRQLSRMVAVICINKDDDFGLLIDRKIHQMIDRGEACRSVALAGCGNNGCAEFSRHIGGVIG